MERSPSDHNSHRRDTPASRDQARILVIDDEPAVCALFRRVLSAEGHDVQVAGNGREAMDLFIENTFDLVITDLVMPDQEGLETIQSLRRKFPDIMILAVSGAFDGTQLRVAEMLGANGALGKPVAPQALREKVAELLRSRQVG